MLEKCSIAGCDNAALRVIRAISSGYCLRHWRELAGNLNHYPVVKLYPCTRCRWIFSGFKILQKHIEEYHRGETNA